MNNQSYQAPGYSRPNYSQVRYQQPSYQQSPYRQSAYVQPPYPQNTYAGAGSYAPPKHKKNGNTVIIILAAIGLIAVIIILAVLLAKYFNEPKDPVIPPVIDTAVTLEGEVLPDSNVSETRSFGAYKAVDGYYDSCWCVNTNRYGGAGAKIRFDLKEEATVSGIKLINGNLYHPYDDIYRSNGQIKTFTLTFSDGSSEQFTASYNAGASADYEIFTFDEPVLTSNIVLTVDSGYVGAKYDTNVCLGEFDVF